MRRGGTDLFRTPPLVRLACSGRTASSSLQDEKSCVSELLQTDVTYTCRLTPLAKVTCCPVPLDLTARQGSACAKCTAESQGGQAYSTLCLRVSLMRQHSGRECSSSRSELSLACDRRGAPLILKGGAPFSKNSSSASEMPVLTAGDLCCAQTSPYHTGI